MDSAINIQENVVMNHDFSHDLQSWHLNTCGGFVLSIGEGLSAANPGASTAIAVIINRNQTWQGLEQDITQRIAPNSIYKLTAYVGVAGSLQGCAEVKATLRLEYECSRTLYTKIASTCVAKGQWNKLDGNFSLDSMPKRVTVYFEGPSSGIHMLIKTVVIMLQPSRVVNKQC